VKNGSGGPYHRERATSAKTVWLAFNGKLTAELDECVFLNLGRR